MKRYAVVFLKDGMVVTTGHGEARDEDDAYEKADMALYCMYNGTVKYDDYRVEEEQK